MVIEMCPVTAVPRPAFEVELTLAVIVPLFSPKVTPLEFGNVIPGKLLEVVPAEIDSVAAAAVFALIVIELPFWLRETL